MVQRADRWGRFLHSAILCPGLPQRWQTNVGRVEVLPPPEDIDSKPPPELGDGFGLLFSLTSFFLRFSANCLAFICSALLLRRGTDRGESDWASDLWPYELRPGL